MEMYICHVTGSHGKALYYRHQLHGVHLRCLNGRQKPVITFFVNYRFYNRVKNVAVIRPLYIHIYTYVYLYVCVCTCVYTCTYTYIFFIFFVLVTRRVHTQGLLLNCKPHSNGKYICHG